MIPLFLIDARYYDERGRPPRVFLREDDGPDGSCPRVLVISVLAVTVRAASSRRHNNRVACGRVS